VENLEISTDQEDFQCSAVPASSSCFEKENIQNKIPPESLKKQNATEKREEAAKRVLKAYGDMIKSPGLDTSRTTSKKHIIKLLKVGDRDGKILNRYSEQDLMRSVENYRIHCERTDCPENYRKHSGTFFGRDKIFRMFIVTNWKAPPQIQTVHIKGFAGLSQSESDFTPSLPEFNAHLK